MIAYRVTRAQGVRVDIDGHAHIEVWLSGPFEGAFARLLTEAVSTFAPVDENFHLAVRGTGVEHRVLVTTDAGSEATALTVFSQLVVLSSDRLAEMTRRQTERQAAAEKAVAEWSEQHRAMG